MEKTFCNASTQRDWKQTLTNTTFCAQNQLLSGKYFCPLEWNLTKFLQKSHLWKECKHYICLFICLFFRNIWLCKAYPFLHFSCRTIKNITLRNPKFALDGCCRNIWSDDHEQPRIYTGDPGLSTIYWWWIGTGWAQIHQDSMEKVTSRRRKEWAVSCRKRISSLGLRKPRSRGFLLHTDHSPLTTLWTMNRSIACRYELAYGQWWICLYMTPIQKRCKSWLLVSPAHVPWHLLWWMMTVHLLHKHTDWLQLQESNIKSFA